MPWGLLGDSWVLFGLLGGVLGSILRSILAFDVHESAGADLVHGDKRPSHKTAHAADRSGEQGTKREQDRMVRCATYEVRGESQGPEDHRHVGELSLQGWPESVLALCLLPLFRTPARISLFLWFFAFLLDLLKTLITRLLTRT